MPEGVAGVARVEADGEAADTSAQTGQRSLGEFAQTCLEFTERHLDRVEIGRILRQIKYPPPDLVSRAMVAGYSTDFSAMPEEWIDRLSLRGEQLTLALIAEYGWRPTSPVVVANAS
jgi:hypothetical protein